MDALEELVRARFRSRRLTHLDPGRDAKRLSRCD